jgi:hypothetical protein
MGNWVLIATMMGALQVTSAPSQACPASYVKSLADRPPRILNRVERAYGETSTGRALEQADTVSKNRFVISPSTDTMLAASGGDRSSSSLIGISLSLDGEVGMAWLDDYEARDVSGRILVTAEISGEGPSRMAIYEIDEDGVETFRGRAEPAFTTVFRPGSSASDMKAWLRSVDEEADDTMGPDVSGLAAYAAWQLAEVLELGAYNPALADTLRRHDWPVFGSLTDKDAQSYLLQ